jgi:hypothetical protein
VTLTSHLGRAEFCKPIASHGGSGKSKELQSPRYTTSFPNSLLPQFIVLDILDIVEYMAKPRDGTELGKNSVNAIFVSG